MFCPGRLAFVLMTCLFVNNCADSKVYCRGLTSVVGWAKLEAAIAPVSNTRLSIMSCFRSAFYTTDIPLPDESASLEVALESAAGSLTSHQKFFFERACSERKKAKAMPTRVT